MRAQRRNAVVPHGLFVGGQFVVSAPSAIMLWTFNSSMPKVWIIASIRACVHWFKFSLLPLKPPSVIVKKCSGCSSLSLLAIRAPIE